jgi:Sulfatase
MEYAMGPLRRYRGNTTWAAALPAALLMAFGGLLAGAHVSPSAAAGPPNIVFLLADDLDERVASGMPRLQELAQSGTRFSKFYVTTPICVPSRATILTGKYAQNTNVRRNTPPFGGYQTFFQDGLEGRTIAVALQQAATGPGSSASTSTATRRRPRRTMSRRAGTTGSARPRATTTTSTSRPTTS